MQARHGHGFFWRSVWRTGGSTRDVGHYSILSIWERYRHDIYSLAR